MDRQFWLDKWRNQQIGFHLPEVNPLLSRHFQQLQLPASASIFLPLCGKSLDIHWLLAQGHHVIGIDLSEIAVLALLDALKLPFQCHHHAELVHYQAQGIDLFVGDFFALQRTHLQQINMHIAAIYDRAALVALPEELRPRYVEHLMTLGKGCRQLLINYDYPQAYMAGPPFAVSDDEIQQRYQPHYRNIRLLEQQLVQQQALAQRIPEHPIWEKVWLLC